MLRVVKSIFSSYMVCLITPPFCSFSFSRESLVQAPVVTRVFAFMRVGGESLQGLLTLLEIPLEV